MIQNQQRSTGTVCLELIITVNPCIAVDGRSSRHPWIKFSMSRSVYVMKVMKSIIDIMYVLFEARMYQLSIVKLSKQV